MKQPFPPFRRICVDVLRLADEHAAGPEIYMQGKSNTKVIKQNRYIAQASIPQIVVYSITYKVCSVTLSSWVLQMEL